MSKNGIYACKNVFRLRADDGPTLNAGMVVLRISGDQVQMCYEILYLCDFSGGGGVQTPCPPSGSVHGTGLCLHLLRYTENPFYRAHRLLYDTLRTFYRSTSRERERERCMCFLNFVIF